jgi:hypothetical protein
MQAAVNGTDKLDSMLSVLNTQVLDANRAPEVHVGKPLEPDAPLPDVPGALRLVKFELHDYIVDTIKSSSETEKASGRQLPLAAAEQDVQLLVQQPYFGNEMVESRGCLLSKGGDIFAQLGSNSCEALLQVTAECGESIGHLGPELHNTDVRVPECGC